MRKAAQPHFTRCECGWHGEVIDTREMPAALPGPKANSSNRLAGVLTAYKRRRYRCVNCNKRWSTVELTVDDFKQHNGWVATHLARELAKVLLANMENYAGALDTITAVNRFLRDRGAE